METPERVSCLANLNLFAQIAIAWVRSLGNESVPVIPIPGAVSVQRVEENSMGVSLTGEELDTLLLSSSDHVSS